MTTEELTFYKFINIIKKRRIQLLNQYGKLK